VIGRDRRFNEPMNKREYLSLSLTLPLFAFRPPLSQNRLPSIGPSLLTSLRILFILRFRISLYTHDPTHPNLLPSSLILASLALCVCVPLCLSLSFAFLSPSPNAYPSACRVVSPQSFFSVPPAILYNLFTFHYLSINLFPFARP